MSSDCSCEEKCYCNFAKRNHKVREVGEDNRGYTKHRAGKMSDKKRGTYRQSARDNGHRSDKF